MPVNNNTLLNINVTKDVFSGKTEELEIIDSEYCLFVLGNEKFKTIKYLTECFYGEYKTTRNI